MKSDKSILKNSKPKAPEDNAGRLERSVMSFFSALGERYGKELEAHREIVGGRQVHGTLVKSAVWKE